MCGLTFPSLIGHARRQASTAIRPERKTFVSTLKLDVKLFFFFDVGRKAFTYAMSWFKISNFEIGGVKRARNVN